ncbi:NAD(P)/FAD-dependent oxidoreductase [Eubacteriales bacterium OttesenSCG-928-N13]|nr:NAD(P)/FAD-dependent oxidoreductase [Eubacteriales bacterium OttesenSCG-928-N13]
MHTPIAGECAPNQGIYDIAIIGAGITGAAIARQLSHTRLKIALIDAQEDVAMGASRANSAIVHAGYDCPNGSLEAELNVRGNQMFTQWCDELGVPLSRCGSLVIGFDEQDEQVLRDLFERGQRNGVPDLALISGEQAREIEPSLNLDVTLALHAPTAGITCPYQLTIACAENARANGVDWVLNAPVTGIDRRDDQLVIHAGGHTINARYVVNAAGVFADEVSRMMGDDSFTIKPRKGEYMLMDRTATDTWTVVFQTPSKLGKGILVSPTVDGNLFVGPTAHDQMDKLDTEVTDEGIAELTRMSVKSVPNLNFRAVITSFAGVRAQPSTGDFIICQSSIEPRLIQAAGICSPGLTSAPAIAELVQQIMQRMGIDVSERQDAIKERPAIREFRHMNASARRAAIAENPLYGRIICRCETISEAEIVEAIHRGARSLDGVKRRTRAGMGRCQGGFCGPRVMEILARELDLTLPDITKSGGDSWLVEEMQ